MFGSLQFDIRPGAVRPLQFVFEQVRYSAKAVLSMYLQARRIREKQRTAVCLAANSFCHPAQIHRLSNAGAPMLTRWAHSIPVVAVDRVAERNIDCGRRHSD